MVYSFFVGMFVGLPIGCYLREVGYANKFKSAYKIFFPDQGIMKSDKLKNKSAQFFESLKRGEVEAKDFEKYVYGGQHNNRQSDVKEVEKEQQKLQILRDMKREL
ncbi:UNKNOWN [Stylonychia lemnae]|uniref:Uncharacterized protein n=1 Tax=Stylonychia lemnae TaxID=5949 RepID=A0A078AHR1_STYLE|nr:UNKNOWN [Stylonychia lemnae]|eukprot:CDW81037.1 UNKNOWN [Stylonychia lemnae]